MGLVVGGGGERVAGELLLGEGRAARGVEDAVHGVRAGRDHGRAVRLARHPLRTLLLIRRHVDARLWTQAAAGAI